MKKGHLLIGVLAAGLAFVTYRAGGTCRTAGGFGACSASFALTQLEATSDFQKIGNTGSRQTAPAWSLKDLDGKRLKLSDFKGNVVILNFWATWCPPCRKEIPTLVSLQRQYGGAGLVVIGVSLDEKGPAVVKPFVSKAGITYPVVMGDPKTVAGYGGIAVVPTTFIIDCDGNVAAVHQGDVERAIFESEIKPLLNEPIKKKDAI